MKKILSVLILIQMQIFIFLNYASAEYAEYLDSSKLKEAKVKYNPVLKSHTPLAPFLAVARPYHTGVRERTENEIQEIKEKLIYPFLLANPYPIAVIIIEFPPNKPYSLYITYYSENGVSAGVLITKNKDGTYGKNAYKRLVDDHAH